MRIECAWCRAYLGEKCPECGSEDLGVGRGEEKNLAQCQECRLIFRVGEDGITSTICEDCRPRAQVSLRRLTEEDIIERAMKKRAGQ